MRLMHVGSGDYKLLCQLLGKYVLTRLLKKNLILIPCVWIRFGLVKLEVLLIRFIVGLALFIMLMDVW